jgi:hypothetical protein
MVTAKNDRAKYFAHMRESVRPQAQKNIELYRQFCNEISDDAIEPAMDRSWLSSVTDGTASYQSYCHSPLWNLITQEVLLRDQHQCALCHRDAKVVHHRSYGFAVMAGLDDDQLISLCNACHHYIHFHKHSKITQRKWDKRYRKLERFYQRKRYKRKCKQWMKNIFSLLIPRSN